jgi:hypothetical protein
VNQHFDKSDDQEVGEAHGPVDRDAHQPIGTVCRQPDLQALQRAIEVRQDRGRAGLSLFTTASAHRFTDRVRDHVCIRARDVVRNCVDGVRLGNGPVRVRVDRSDRMHEVGRQTAHGHPS